MYIALLQGVSLNTFQIGHKKYPLIYAGNAPNITGGFTGNTSRYLRHLNSRVRASVCTALVRLTLTLFHFDFRFCTTGSLNATQVKGKIVLCEASGIGEGPFLIGAAGAILYDGGVTDVGYTVPLPASLLSATSLNSIYRYLVAVPG